MKIICESFCFQMDKSNRSQLPDSSSSPPLSGLFHSFDDENMSELPSCVFANIHHHHQLNSSQMSMNSIGMTSNGNQSPSVNNNLRMNANTFKIHQHFMHHSAEISDVPTTSTSSQSMSNFSGPMKNSRQHGSARERKRTLKSAPNGYSCTALA